ncbi:rhomboid family intramembrane serine protease [Candidatus Bathyarchaeota archaeon]|nr:rhomboid family intramembrane serine protease [Candidatus Bathyarchaeota archaeon]
MKKTYWLIIMCILTSIFIWTQTDNEQIIDYLVLNGENLLKGRVWTLVTSLFIHSDFSHLFGNMIFLYIFGTTIENELDWKWLLFPFLGGGVVSFLISGFFYDPSIYLVGASAAIFTLTAMVMLLKPLKFSFCFLMPLGLVAIIYFSYNLVAIYMGSQGNISYIGHIIGFCIGLPLGILKSKEWPKNLLISGGLFLIYLLIVWLIFPSLGIIFLKN